ncbi:hypothetical protein X801_03784 [Opisthorchis viverrini]|uniref:Uncharacterized protein n=1 Tax=Opisthorchis viverrini TaxID=6198 RepID=A0A1S8X0Y5_OPIVI|nr:hypothetical protein X801_03784 [Opisthorchis viverrini]
MIIDRFAILSFRTRGDLTLYTQHTSADHLKASSTHITGDKTARSRRTCATRKRRTKSHYNRVLEDSCDALDSSWDHNNGYLTNGLCIDNVHSNRSPDACVEFPMVDSDSEDHGRSNQLDADSASHLTLFRISKYPQSTSPGANRDAIF